MVPGAAGEVGDVTFTHVGQHNFVGEVMRGGMAPDANKLRLADLHERAVKSRLRIAGHINLKEGRDILGS